MQTLNDFIQANSIPKLSKSDIESCIIKFISHQVNEVYTVNKILQKQGKKIVLLDAKEFVAHNSNEVTQLIRLGGHGRLWSVEKNGANTIALKLTDECLIMLSKYK